ncbi:MAG: carbon storage regulator [Phycisphaerae bacterium]
MQGVARRNLSGVHHFTRKVDQWIVIGREIAVGPTDIDDAGVRLVANGRVMGGPNDGEPFKSVHDVQPGQSFNVSPMVAVTVIARRGDEVDLGVLAPPNVEVERREVIDGRP